MKELVLLLKEHHLTLASCESVSGGDFASAMTDVSGASDVYLGGTVVYTDMAKNILIGVENEVLELYGSVSEETVRQMAVLTKQRLNSDLAIAFSGNAGPRASSDKPVGRIYTAIACSDECLVFQDDLTGSRKEIKQKTVDLGIVRLKDWIKGNYQNITNRIGEVTHGQSEERSVTG